MVNTALRFHISIGRREDHDSKVADCDLEDWV